MTSPFDADVDSLISQGWGSHARALIPADWQTRRGPDQAWSTAQKARGYQRKRSSWRRRRSIDELAVQKYVTD